MSKDWYIEAHEREVVAQAIWDFCNPRPARRPIMWEREYNLKVADAVLAALAAAARQGGDVKQAPGEAPQSGAKRNAQGDAA